MDIYDLGSRFAPGPSLNVEERAALEVQMAKRQHEERLHSIKFWGRVTGTTADYLIVFGTTATMGVPSKKWFYATTKNLVLQQLPELTDAFVGVAKSLVGGRFLGNPAKLLGPDADAPEDEDGGVDEAGNPKPKTVRFSEAHRLAYTVAAIDHDTGLVPRGAFAVTPTHQVAENALFPGLSATEAGSLASYYHFRPAEHPSRAHALYKAGVVAATDFLDPASEDGPKAELVWSVRLALGSGLAEVRSLKWPGYFFLHSLGTPKYGGIYCGDGLENKDLHFMQ